VLEGKPCLVLVDRPESVTLGSNLANEPRDTFVFNRQPVPAVQVAGQPEMEGHSQVVWEGALLRAQQMAGAMHRVLDMTITYALEREQFGRAIAKFQAIQQQIAEQAGQTASVAAAAEAATLASGHSPAPAAIAMAK